jgi:O-antigen/teichoic acid export membrane protein
MSHWAVDTVLLAIVQFIAGVIAFFYRIFLSKHLGPKGMGIYQQILTFYGTFILLMTAGIPIAVSTLISDAQAKTENYDGKILILNSKEGSYGKKYEKALQ